MYNNHNTPPPSLTSVGGQKEMVTRKEKIEKKESLEMAKEKITFDTFSFT